MDVNGGPLSFDATIDDSTFQASINNMEQSIIAVTNTIENQGAAIDNVTSASVNNANRTSAAQLGLLEDLKAKLANYKIAADEAMSVTALELYNAKIQETQVEIVKLTNVGKIGFDDMGNAITRSYERPVGTINRLIALQKIYKDGAATMTNPELIAKYNAKLEETAILLARATNIGKVGFDELGNAIVVAEEKQSKFGAALSRVTDISNIGAKAVTSLSRQIIGLGVGMLSFAIGAKAIEALVQYIADLDLFSVKLNQAILDKRALSETMLKGSQDAQKELVNVKLLYDEYQNASLPLKQRKQAYDELQKLYPDYFANIAFEGTASDKTAASYDKLTEAILATARARAAADKIAENSSRQLDDEQKITDLKEQQLKDQVKLNRAKILQSASGVSAASSTGASSTNVFTDEQVHKQLSALEDDQKKINALKTDGNILTARNVDLVKSVNAEEQKGAVIEGSVGGKKAKDTTSSDASLLAAQTSLAERIQALKDKYTAKGLTKDEDAQAAVLADFKKLTTEITAEGVKYDAYAKKNGDAQALKVLGPKQTAASLEPIKTAAIADLTYRQNTAKYGIELERQKVLYQDYEKYKANFGEDAANAQYSDDLGKYSTYLEKLEAERAALLTKDPTLMSGPEKERLELVDKQVNAQVLVQKDAYNTLLLANNSYEEKKAAVTSKYNDAFTKLTGDGNADRRAVLTKGYQDELDALIDSNFAKTAAAKRLGEGVLVLTRSQIKDQIAALTSSFSGNEVPVAIQKQIDTLKARLKVGADQGNLDSYKQDETDIIAKMTAETDKASPKFQALIAQLTEIKEKIKAADPDGDGTAGGGGLGSFLASLDPSGKGSIAAGSMVGLADVGNALDTFSAGLADTNSSAAYTLDTLGKLAGAAANLGTAIISGDPQKIIQASIQAIGTLFSLAKKTKEANAAALASVQAYYAAAITGERAYQELLAQRAIDQATANDKNIAGIKAEMALRVAQLNDYNTQEANILTQLQGLTYISGESYTHGTWFKKASTNNTYASLNGMDFAQISDLLSQGKLEGSAKDLATQLVALEQKGYDAQQAIDDLAASTAALFTGTTSDNLTDALTQMFEDGKTSAADFADFFKTTMDEAAISIFKNNVINKMMTDFYASFDAAAESGNELTADEITALKAQYNDDIAKATAAWADYQDITGSDLTGGASSSSTSTSTGAAGVVSAAITEDSANRLLGIAQSEFDEIQRQGLADQAYYSAAVANFGVIVKIEANTFRTANNTDNIDYQLAQIIVNTDKTGSTSLLQALRNAGSK